MSSSGYFSPRKDLVPIVQEAGWAQGPVWTDAKILSQLFFEPQAVQPVVRRCANYAVSGPKLLTHLPEFAVTLGVTGLVIHCLL
jgi:hypothetical protein